jgi:hypothetical protein
MKGVQLRNSYVFLLFIFFVVDTFLLTGNILRVGSVVRQGATGDRMRERHLLRPGNPTPSRGDRAGGDVDGGAAAALLLPPRPDGPPGVRLQRGGLPGTQRWRGGATGRSTTTDSDPETNRYLRFEAFAGRSKPYHRGGGVLPKRLLPPGG